MQKTDVINIDGQKITSLSLNEYVFGIEPHKQALYDVVNSQRSAMRQGTHDVKNRGEVSGGGKKPWRQKGTGKARQGSIRSPQWRGGGVVFGPTPRSYNVKFNQKVRQLALRSALSYHKQNGTLIVVEKLEFATPKTKGFLKFLEGANVSNKVLVVDKELSENVVLASRNLSYVMVSTANHVSVYDILNYKHLLLTTEAVKYFEEALKND